jgi:hypothetical protein
MADVADPMTGEPSYEDRLEEIIHWLISRVRTAEDVIMGEKTAAFLREQERLNIRLEHERDDLLRGEFAIVQNRGRSQ